MVLDGHAAESIALAADTLRSGELFGLPTETVYGLAADAENANAVAKIFQAKGRPLDHPLIVHVLDAKQAQYFASAVPDFAQALMDAFWPGPLTLILPRRPGVAAAAAGGQDSIGLRSPGHPVAHAVLQACAQTTPPVRGLAAPSANQFGRISPTSAAHVQSEFGEDLLVLEGGPCAVGIESTIIDCTRGQPVLLRPGAITPAQVQAVCGLAVLLPEQLQAKPAPRASGTLESHYAPRATLRLMDAAGLQAALVQRATEPNKLLIGIYARADLAARAMAYRCMPLNASAAAHELFATLRELDAMGMQEIWVEAPPKNAEWDGVRDRLTRAAA